MLKLRPANPEETVEFVELSISALAHDCVVAGRYGNREEAMSNARDVMGATSQRPDSRILAIADEDILQTVGFLWHVVLKDPSGKDYGWVHQLLIMPAYRHRAYGRRALLKFESLCISLGYYKYGLHVFFSNMAACALYDSVGLMFSSHGRAVPVLTQNLEKLLPPQANQSKVLTS